MVRSTRKPPWIRNHFFSTIVHSQIVVTLVKLLTEPGFLSAAHTIVNFLYDLWFPSSRLLDYNTSISRHPTIIDFLVHTYITPKRKYMKKNFFSLSLLLPWSHRGNNYTAYRRVLSDLLKSMLLASNKRKGNNITIPGYYYTKTHKVSY